MLGETIRKFLLRGGLKKKQDNQKKEKNGEHVYSNRMTVVAPITLALALPEIRGSSHSLATYGHEDLIPIDGIPRPAFPRSFSAGMLHEERSQRDRHIRYETLDKRGLKLSTVVVGPKRSAALAEWEGLAERAGREVESHLPVPPRTAEGGEESKEMMEGGTGREFGDFTVAVPAKPAPVRDEENLVGYKVKSTHRRVAKKACLGLRRWVDSKVGSIKRPNRDPVARGFRFWLRDGLTRRSTPLARACMAETDQGQRRRCTHARGTLFLSPAPLPQGLYHAKSIETSLELLGTISPTVLRPSRKNTRHMSSGWTLRGPSIKA
ncbi:hypothetical protein TWF173_011392 [Orbilia oligospora]|nr:hypothetical protein TWF173_011392 [Orbilia oligospora]